MAVDGLKMIHLRGYDGDPEEVFQGIGGSGLLDLSGLLGLGGGGSSGVSVSVTPSINVDVPPSSLPIAPIPEIPKDWIEAAMSDGGGLLDDILTYVQNRAQDVGIEDEDDYTTSRSLGRSRAFGALVPVVTTLAGWASKVPAIFKGGAGLAIFWHVIQEIIDDIEDNLDPTSERWRLYGIEKRLKEIYGVLHDGLLKDYNPAPDARKALLEEIWEALDQISSQPPVQEEFDVGDVRIISGKIIEY